MTNTTQTQIRRWPLWLLIVCITAAMVWLFYRPQKTTLIQEVSRKELVLREGKLYRNGDQTPFQGFLIEKYSGGNSNLKSRSEVREGRLNGFSEGWHTNGQMEVKEFFTNGLSHGLRTRWYATGAKMSETMIVSGVLNGVSQRWYSNGVMEASLSLKNGTPDGISKSYYESGCLKAVATMQNGKTIEMKTWKDGEVKEPALSKNEIK